MVCYEVIAQLFDSLLYGKCFSFSSVILFFGQNEFKADVDYWMYRTSPSNSCNKTAPSPVSEVSVCTIKGRLNLGFLTTGSVVKTTFNCWKAVSAIGVHLTCSGVAFLVRSDTGEATEEKLGTHRR